MKLEQFHHPKQFSVPFKVNVPAPVPIVASLFNIIKWTHGVQSLLSLALSLGTHF